MIWVSPETDNDKCWNYLCTWSVDKSDEPSIFIDILKCDVGPRAAVKQGKVIVTEEQRARDKACQIHTIIKRGLSG